MTGNKIHKNKSQSGLTLIEMMVALFVFSIVVLIAIAIFVNVVQGQRKTKANQDVEENIRYALETMAKEVRMGKDPTLNGANLEVEAYKSGGTSESVIYSLIGGQIYRKNSPITSDQIQVTKLNFYVSSAANTQPKVTISITANSIGSLPEQKTSITVQTTVSSRSYTGTGGGGGGSGGPVSCIGLDTDSDGDGDCEHVFFAGIDDGYVSYNAAVWNTVHNANNGNLFDDSSGLAKVQSRRGLQMIIGNYSMIARAFFPFDTSALNDAGCTILIVKAEFKFYVNSVGASTDYRLVEASQQFTDQLRIQDYNKCGLVTDPITLATDQNINSSGSKIFNFSDLNAIKTDGSWTKLGIREATYDAPNNQPLLPPGVPPAFGENNYYIEIQTSENTNQPTLVVEYKCL